VYDSSTREEDTKNDRAKKQKRAVNIRKHCVRAGRGAMRKTETETVVHSRKEDG